MMKQLVCLIASFPVLSAYAAERPPQVCKVTFSVVYQDRLGNYNTGVPEKSVKDVESRLQKFGDVCYVAGNKGDLVFFIHTTPSTYHGTRVYTNSSSSAAAAASANSSAAAAASSTSTTAVPYDVDYSVFILDVELPMGDGSYEVVQTFDQKGLYRTIYGIGYGKGKHPIPNVIEASAGWVHEHFDVADLAAARLVRPVIVPPLPVPAAQMASVTVDASVPNCEISLDGDFVGNTPSTLSVAPGKHVILVKKTGFADWSRSMAVNAGSIKVNAEMAAK